MRTWQKDGGYLLNGTKTMISGGPVADAICAVTDQPDALGISCFHVEGDRGIFSPAIP
jgi:alkylation response protein AidB-like acyl-CoA dehydrogenase